MTSDQFYTMKLEQCGDITAARVQYGWEYEWCRTGRPYYNLYPGIIEMLLRLNLDKVEVASLRPPNGLKSIIVNMPVGNKMMDDGRDMQNLFINVDLMHAVKAKEHGIKGFGLYYGETFAGSRGWDVSFSNSISIKSDGTTTIGDVCRLIEKDQQTCLEAIIGKKPSKDETLKLNKLCAAICLIDSDSELLLPELLSKDVVNESRKNVSLKELQERAKKRGKFGWSLGKDVDRLPHERRPHPALYWTGPGGKKPVVLIRAGSIVKRNLIGEVPTGYYDLPETDSQN